MIRTSDSIGQRSWKVTIRKLKKGYMLYIGYHQYRCDTFEEVIEKSREHFGEK